MTLEVFLLQGEKRQGSREYCPPSLFEGWHLRTPHFLSVITRLHVFLLEKSKEDISNQWKFILLEEALCLLYEKEKTLPLVKPTVESGIGRNKP